MPSGSGVQALPRHSITDMHTSQTSQTSHSGPPMDRTKPTSWKKGLVAQHRCGLSTQLLWRGDARQDAQQSAQPKPG